jgi:hypothetical protein
VEGKNSMDPGWAGFAIDHEMKIDYFLTFKALKNDSYKVTIFDHSMNEIVKKCLEHDPALAMIDREVKSVMVCVSNLMLASVS